MKKKIGMMMPAIIMILIGGVCGLLMGRYLIEEEFKILDLFVLFAGMYLLLMLQIVIHETGHMIFGLLSGYTFCSIRFGNLMILKENGKLKMKRFSLAGTGGQCIMIPPEGEDIPVILYNLGGVLMNLIVSVIALIVWIIFPTSPLVSYLLLIFVVIGIGYVVVNGVPLKEIVNNDGANALELSKDPHARKAFQIMFLINAETSKGVDITEMPEEWFFMPAEEDLHNSISSSIGVFYCNRLFAMKKFEEAKIAMESMIRDSVELVAVYKNMLTCDLIYIAVLEGDYDHAKELHTSEIQKFMKTMVSQPDVQRDAYAYTLKVEQDEKKANNIVTKLNQMRKNYPYPSEIDSAFTFIDLIKNTDERSLECLE